ILLDRYNLKAEESLFIDDNIHNIESAQKIGFHTIHFTNDTDLEKEVKAMGVL
ncbi:MAG: HAD-IA family hydrolase, partial [Bacteroidales bacterium]|nr:HAD-IA family hydrolase [Bacteroidales bacterium]